MSEVSDVVATLVRLMPQLIDWIKQALSEGKDPDTIAQLHGEAMRTVARNRKAIDDMIEEKFPSDG